MRLQRRDSDLFLSLTRFGRRLRRHRFLYLKLLDDDFEFIDEPIDLPIRERPFADEIPLTLFRVHPCFEHAPMKNSPDESVRPQRVQIQRVPLKIGYPECDCLVMLSSQWVELEGFEPSTFSRPARCAPVAPQPRW